MKREIITTKDGSHSILIPNLNETYHSKFGAIQESAHVFIKHGFLCFKKSNLKLLEIGLGTGLNALLTKLKSDKLKLKTIYEAIELYPLNKKEYRKLNFANKIHVEKNEFLQIHQNQFDKKHKFSDYFYFIKRNEDVLSYQFTEKYDLIYFDAFAPNKQPEVWSEDVLRKMYNCLKNGGALVTYCSRGVIKRRLKDIGFTIETLEGPPGKREMIRANKK
tara:strand:+ start:55 stop:711 length:657 start_codon:yes stop_codon:yes gene_type:complete